jgi:hypothetical protein
MPFVQISDFIGEVVIAQTEQVNVATTVNRYIAKYETEYLKKVLGHTLFAQYNAGIIANTPAYLELRNGGTYTDLHGDTVIYEGLKEAIVNYIYFHYIRDTVTFTTGGGEKKTDPPRAVSSLDKQVRAWNRMTVLSKAARCFIYAKQSVYNVTSWQINDIFRPINTLGL